MRKRPGFYTAAGLLLCAWFLAPAITAAQIATYVDAEGKTVYINAELPRSKQRTAVSASAASPTANPAPPATPAAAPGFAGKTLAAAPSGWGSAAADKSRVNPGLDQVINDAAYRHRVDPALVRAVIDTESGGNPYAISRKGAVGLMQLIPSTAQRFGVANALDPAQNIEGGTTYLRALLDRYNGDLTKSLAAYNAGERAVDLRNGVPAYRETRRYVQKVTNTYYQSDSGRDETLLNPFRPKVRQEVDSSGRVVYTND